MAEQNTTSQLNQADIARQASLAQRGGGTDDYFLLSTLFGSNLSKGGITPIGEMSFLDGIGNPASLSPAQNITGLFASNSIIRAFIDKFAEGRSLSPEEITGVSKMGGAFAGVGVADNAPSPMQTGQLNTSGIPKNSMADDYMQKQANER